MNKNVDTDLLKLQPKRVWKYFLDLCLLPRPSKHEEKVVAYLEEFAKQFNLKFKKDDVGNVIIYKQASSPIMKVSKMVMLQAHIDMVPQKVKEKTHNFLTDPITAYINGDWVTADGTTLGADNGIGVAMMLAILESDTIEHGPIEALFTVDEEVGMSGMRAVPVDQLQADIMLNLDAEEEGVFYIGSAGTGNVDLTLKFENESVPKDSVAVQIEVSGLIGGHSGADIHRERGNAIKILSRILWQAEKHCDIKLASFFGGSFQHNAIPREASAVMTVLESSLKDLYGLIEKYRDIITTELAATDPNLRITCQKVELPETTIELSVQNIMLRVLNACPHGVIQMSKDIEGLVQTSVNLAHADTNNNQFTVLTMSRSSVDSFMLDIVERVACLFELTGGGISRHGFSFGWKPCIDSEIVKLAEKVYEEKEGKKPIITAIHAGLESGVLAPKYPNMDIISFGPTIKLAHSPDEKVNIQSVEKFWDFLLALLKRIPGK